MRNRVSVLVLTMAVLVAAVAPVAAQEDPALQPQPAVPSESAVPESFGLGTQDTWIAATQFNPMNGSSIWAYQTFLYFAVAAGGTMLTQLPLDPGARVTQFQCFFNDTVAADANVIIWRNTYNISTNARNNVNIVQVQTAGSTGFQNPATATDFTVLYNEGNERVIYWLQANMGANVELRGCRVLWRRTLSTAPAVATFADVPTTHIFFQWIEAFNRASITGGCGGGNFCPNDPVTRGQMAVFLATALGLHFPQ